jgi:O-antigen ligase
MSQESQRSQECTPTRTVLDPNGSTCSHSEVPNDFGSPRVAGLLVMLLLAAAVLIFVPPTAAVLNFFDPPKRCVWGGLLVLLAFLDGAAKKRTWDLAAVSAVLLGCWMVARTLTRPNPLAELSVLFVWLLPLALFLLGQQVALCWRRRMAGTLGALVIVQLIIMGLQYAGLDPFFSATTEDLKWPSERMVGTIGYHNQAAEFLGLGSTAFLLIAGGGVLGLVGGGLSLLGIGLTACRTALLAACAGLGVSRLSVMGSLGGQTQGRRRSLAASMLFAVVVIAAVVGTSHARNRWLSIFERGTWAPGVSSRYLLARVGLDMVGERPWTGWGAGEYAYQYLDRIGAVRRSVDASTAGAVVYAREAHNDWIQFMAEFGAVGLLLAGVLFWRIVFAAWEARRTDPRRFTAVLYVMIFMAVSAIGAFVWQTAVTGPAAGFLLGWLTPSRPSDIDRLGKRVGLLVGALVRTCSLGGAVLVFSWFAGEAFWSKQVADGLADGMVTELCPLTPRWAYRTHGILGGALAQEGRYAQAESELRHALEGYREPILYNNLGNVLVSQGKWADAEAIYRRWADSGINEATALSNLAVVYEKEGKIRDAAETLWQKDSMVPANSMIEVQRLAGLLLRAGDAERAVARIRLYERQSGGAGSLSPELENIAGAADMITKDYSNAVVRFEAALRKDPNQESARRNLENARARLADGFSL